MGQEILYCYKCQTRLLGSEFEKGKAFKVGAQAACPVCVKDLLGSVPEVGTESERGRKLQSTARIPAAGPDSSSKHKPARGPAPAPPPPPEKSRNGLIVGGVIGAVVILILVAMAMGSGRTTVTRHEPAPVDPPLPAPLPAPVPPPTPAPPTIAGELREIDDRLRTALGNEQFRSIADFLAEARKRRATPEWTTEIDQRIPLVEARARRVALPLRERAAEALKRKDDAEVQRLRDRVAAWGFPAVVEEFDKSLVEAPAPPPPPPTPTPPAPIPTSSEPPLIVYGDALAAGTRNLSWSSTIELAAASPVFEGGKSIAITPKEMAAGLYIALDQGVDPAQYPLVSFAVYLNDDAVGFGVALYKDWKPAGPVGPEKMGGSPAPRTWKKFIVPVADLNPTGQKITGFILQVFKTGTQPLIYVDSIAFLRGMPPAAPPEAEAARGRWTQALAKASGRDYAAAFKVLEEGGPASAADLELLKLAAQVPAEAAKAVERWTKGQKVKLDFVNAAGEREAAEGTVLSADAVRVSLLRDAGPLDLPVSELHASTLAELFRGRSDRKPTDARAAAAFCLIEGEAESARKHEPAPPERLLGAPVAEPDRRKAFWAAEADFLNPKRRSAAVEKFAALLSGEATPFAARIRPYVGARLEAAKDTVFLAEDLGAAGTFVTSTSAKIDVCWTSTADSAAAKARENYVEAEFHVFPGLAYRAWIWAGACCQETYDYSVQATELTVPNPKSPKEPLPCEPGGETALTGKLPGATLRKWHAQHGGPKEPARFEWIPLTLPKYETPGVKKLRLLTAQQGFSIGAVVVSATRRETPREAEIKDLEKLRFGSRKAGVNLGPQGMILYEWWHGIEGDRVEQLTKHPSFSGKPSGSSYMTSFEGTRDAGDNFGSRMRGYVHPPVSGPYVFWMATDDGGELYLSSDESPARKRQLAVQTMATGFREWTRYPTQKSAPVALVAGRRYYVEVLHKEGNVSDHLSVGWTLPDGSEEKPIPGSRLSPWSTTPPSAGPAGTTFFRGYDVNGPPTVIDGRKWEGKGHPTLAFSTEGAFENQNVPLDPPVADDAKASMIRSSAFAQSGTVIKVYQVPAGSYQVYLYLWEDNDNQVIDLFLNGREVAKGHHTGKAGHWDKLGPWPVTVADAVLEVRSAGGHANLSGLEIWKVTK